MDGVKVVLGLGDREITVEAFRLCAWDRIERRAIVRLRGSKC